jgi:hypothetical protein
VSEPTVKKFPTIKRSLTPKPRPGISELETTDKGGQEARPLAAVHASPPSTTKPRPKPPQPARTTRATEPSNRSLSFLIPDDLRAAFKARATRDHQSLPNVLLDAIEATHHELGGALRAEEPSQPTTGLFQRPQRREPGGRQSTIVIRVPTQALETIDELWQRAEADNRSQFIRAALRKYLAPEKS